MDPLAAFALGVLGAAAAALPVLLWQRRLVGQARRRNRVSDEATEKNREMLATAPDGLFMWDVAGGGESCSRRLAVLLELAAGTDSRFADVAALFEGAPRETLNEGVAALRRDGESFEALLAMADGRRLILAMGVRAGAADGQPLADLLWMRDVTDGPGTAAAARDGPGTERRLGAVLDLLPLPVWLRQGDLEVAWANRDGAALAGPTRDLAARALGEGKAVAERHLLTLDESPRLFEITETPMDGWPGTIGFAVDLSEAEHMEGEFARHAQARDQVLDSLTTAIAIFGADGSLMFFNKAYSELWRLDDGWLSAKPGLGEILDRLREARRLPEVADFRAYKDEQLGCFGTLQAPLESHLHLPDGTTLSCLVGPHSLGGLVFAYEDVTERLALERSYNTLIAVQGETLDNLHEGVAVFGSDGRLKLSNPEFARLWKLDRGPLADGPHISEVVEGMRPLIDDGEDWPEQKARFIARLVGRQPATGQMHRGDGSALRYAHVPLPDGAVLLSYLDVTDSARVERALRQRAEALQEAGRLKSEFIANVSYEVRTPLNTVIGFAEILAGSYFGDLNARQMEYGRGILESAQDLMKVIDDILDLAAIEAGMMTLELDTVDLHSMLVSVLNLTRERIRRKNLSLNFDCRPDIGWIVADEKRLKQVLFNLVSNAVNFTPPRGEVRLAAWREDEEVVLEVSDNGPGIPPEDRQRVLLAFERGTSPEASRGGAGLGLSLVARFIELHGGRVEVTSALNKGTRVTCRLPVAGEQEGKGNDATPVSRKHSA